jgi:tryptophan-rich sensory protein
MTAAIVILLVIGTLVVVIMPSREEFTWFLRLRRPHWLSFEGWIPLIWLCIYGCFYASALVAWNRTSSWGLMVGYVVLLVLVSLMLLIRNAF